MENWLNYVKTKYVVTDIADESIVYETIVEGDIRNVIMPSDIIRSRKDYRLSIYLETDDEQINSKLSNKLLASLVWNSSALKLTGDDGINLGDLVTTDIFQTTINNILNQLSSIDLSQYYKKDESHTHFVEDVVHIGDTPPDDTNMLWYDTSDTSYAPDALSLFNLRGTVNDKSELPATGVKDGDVYKVVNNNGYVVFNNGHWDVIGYEGPVVIASYDEPTNKNVIWYDLNEDGPDDTGSSTGNLADNFKFRWVRNPNDPSSSYINKLINYSNAAIEYKVIKEEIIRAFKDISIRAPLNISANYFPQYEQLRNINGTKDIGTIPLVKSVEFLQEPDFSSTSVRYSNTILPLIANVMSTYQIIPIKVTMFDGSSKEFNLVLYLYRNPLESVTTNYVERIEVPISQVWNGSVPNGTEFTGTLFYFGPELVIGYHPHGGEATYRHKFTLPVMSVESIDEYIGLVGSDKFHDLEPEAMNKVIQDMNLSFTPKTTIKDGKLVLFIPGGMTGTRKIAMDQPISGSDIYVTLKKDGISKEFVLKRYEDYNTQDFTDVKRYGFDIVKMDLLTLINKDYDRKDYEKVTTLANPLSKYIGCFLQGNGASSTGKNTNTGFLYFNHFIGSVFHNIREVTPNTTDIKNLSLSSGNVMWYNKFVDQTTYQPLLKNSKKQSQCGLNVTENIELITLPSDGNKKLFIQITQPQHNINTGTKLYRIDVPLGAFTALGLPVPAYVIESVSKLINVNSQAPQTPVEDPKPELSSLFKIWETKYDFDSGVTTTNVVEKIQYFINYNYVKPNEAKENIKQFFLVGSAPEVLPYKIEQDGPSSFWTYSNPNYIDTSLFTRTIDIGQVYKNYWVNYKCSRITDRQFLAYKPYEEVNSVVKDVIFLDGDWPITEDDILHSYNFLLKRSIPITLVFDDNSEKDMTIELTYTISNSYLTNVTHYVNRVEVNVSDIYEYLKNGDQYVGTVSWTSPAIVLANSGKSDEITYANHISIPLMSPEKYDEMITATPDTDLFKVDHKEIISTVANNKVIFYLPAASVPNDSNHASYAHRIDWGLDQWSTPRHLAPMRIKITKVVNGVPDESTTKSWLITRDKSSLFGTTLGFYTQIDAVKVDYSKLFTSTGTTRSLTVYAQVDRTDDNLRSKNPTSLTWANIPVHINGNSGYAGFFIPKIKAYENDQWVDRWMTEIRKPQHNYPEHWLPNAVFTNAKIDEYTGLLTNVYLGGFGENLAGDTDPNFIWPVFDPNGPNKDGNIRMSVISSNTFTTSLPSDTNPPTHINGWVYNDSYNLYRRTLTEIISVPSDIFAKYGLPTPERVI